MRALAGAACAAVGVAAGPLLARLAARVPEKVSLRGGDWRAPDVIPITGAAAALFAAIGVRLGGNWALPGFLVFASCLIVISVTDLRLFLIPNRVIYPTLFASVVLLGGAALLSHDVDALRRAVVGGLAAWFALFVVHFINPRGMAFGDVRLAGVIGAYMGWLGAGHVFLGLFLGFLSAAAVGVVLIVTKRRGSKDPVPFGPFLALGAIAATLFGNTLLHWYTGS